MNHSSFSPASRRFAAGLFLSVSLVAGAPFADAASNAKKEEPGILEKIDRWQDRMSDKFRDTWNSLWDDKKGGSLTERSHTTASVDVREQKDSFTVRLNLPNRDLEKVEVRLEPNGLHVLAPPHGQLGRYQQVIALPGVQEGLTPNVERRDKDHLIVVTIPKGESPAIAQATPDSTVPDPAVQPFRDWDRDIMERMAKMRREMDRTFREAFGEFRDDPSFKGFFDESRFGSALDLQEEGDNYVVRAYLPDREVKNINVTVEGQTLKLEAKEEQTTRKEDQDTGTLLRSSRQAAYMQALALPGPVQSDKMKVDRKEGVIVVTLPKAK